MGNAPLNALMTLVCSIDTFKQFFPSIDPYGGSRLRAHPAANVMGKAMTDYFESISSDDYDYTYLYANKWVASTRLNANTDRKFASWEEFFGPQVVNGDSFTTTVCIPLKPVELS